MRQGVTTEITGNCGSSAAPLGPRGEDRGATCSEDGHDADWSRRRRRTARGCEQTRIAVNQALLAGPGHAAGDRDRERRSPRHRRELASLLRAVEQGMDQGAFGLSTGLEYTPGRYTPTDEIVAMARVVARHGGLYASHTRNEEKPLLEAVDEAIAHRPPRPARGWRSRT